MKQIYLISGKAESGKNEVADIMAREYVSKGYKCLTIAYGDDLKHIAKTYFGWDGKKDEHGRKLLQYIGTDLVREKMKRPNYWVNRVMDIIQMVEDSYDYIFIPDCRFPNEIEIPYSQYKNMCTSIRIERSNHRSKLTPSQLTHISEIALDNYKFDTYIHNYGSLETLREIVKQKILYPITNCPNYQQFLAIKKKQNELNLLIKAMQDK